MTDTQWPVYVVFVQEREDRPHKHAGSVHAPDGELALMNARDVFVRRPACVSLWVAPAAQVSSWTAEELQADLKMEEEEGERRAFAIFQKWEHKGSAEFAGQVWATSPARALALARAEAGSQEALVWWVVPDEAIHRSAPGDLETDFTPAERKEFRRSTFFHTLTEKRRIKGGGREESDAG